MSESNEREILRNRALCLSCYGARSDENRPAAVSTRSASPFPFIAGRRTAATLLPIKAYWFPSDGTLIDWLLLASHESVHLLLADTPLSFYALALNQVQFVTLCASVFRDGNRISLPSLVEATGFIATSQQALDYVGPAIAFVHELMASTLVRAYNDEGLTIMTSQLWKDGYNTILRGHPDWQVPEIEEAILNENNLLVDMNSIVRPERMRRFEKDLWLPAYERSFPGYQFRKTHARLMKAWRKIITSIVEGSWHNVLLALVRYPFDIQLRRLKPFTWESISIAVDGLCAYLQLEENEPRRRLETMLRTIERAPAFKHESLWQEYLRASLPGYGTWNSGTLVLAEFAAGLWSSAGFPAIGEIFKNACSEAFGNTLLLTHAPIVKDDHFPFWAQLLVGLEILRQSMLAPEAPRCFCAGDQRNSCKVKGLLALLWGLADPDNGFENDFSQLWRKPVCADTVAELVLA